MSGEAAQGGEAARTELARLRATGSVEKVLLRPAEMGGKDAPGNVTWLPPACARQKHAFDARVQQQWGRGVPVEYAAVPAYEGDSLIPVRLVLTARAVGQNLHAVIDVARHRRPTVAARRPWWKFW
jgi:hypothetical protein